MVNSIHSGRNGIARFHEDTVFGSRSIFFLFLILAICISRTAAATAIIASKAEISAFLDGLDAKIAWSENREQLVYLDIATDVLEMQRPSTPIPAQVPTLSPDGKWVAFSDKSDGLFGGQGYVQPLSPAGGGHQAIPGASVVMPRWWVNPWSGDTTLTYVDHSRNNDLVYCTEKGVQSSIDDPVNNPFCVGKQVGDIKINPWEDEGYLFGSVFSGGILSPEAALARGPWEAGISRDGQFTAAGQGTGAWFRNMGTNARLKVFLPPASGFAQAIQICNVSMSPSADSPDEIMIIDFGSSGAVNTLTGTAYDIHQMIYIVNAQGIVTNWIPSPAADERMDNPDWSTHPKFAITNARKISGTAGLSAIYLINLETKAFLKVIESDSADLWHPSLWVRYDAPRVPFQASEPGITLDPSGIRQFNSRKGKSMFLTIPELSQSPVRIPEGMAGGFDVYDISGRSILPLAGPERAAAASIYFLRMKYQEKDFHVQKVPGDF